jgi:hypothetical protein
MDWKTFLAQNTSALLALIGVIVGFVISLLFQVLQRRWTLYDYRMNSKRELFLNHIDSARSYVYSLLKMLKTYDFYINSRDGTRDEPLGFREKYEQKIWEDYEEYISKSATVDSDILAIRDNSLMQLCGEFRKITGEVHFFTAIDNVPESITTKLLIDLNISSSQVLRRLDELVDELYSRKLI